MTALKCPICGAPLPPSKTKPRKFCSKKCANKARHGFKPSGVSLELPAELSAERKRRQLEQCRETASITVEERGGIRIETRGQRCIGWRSAGCVKHV